MDQVERRVLRWEVPVDDEWHHFDFAGGIVHVAARRIDVVEFWTTGGVYARTVGDGAGRLTAVHYQPAKEDVHTWEMRVFGTGHVIEDGVYLGTALTPNGGMLVWHLLGRQVP